MKKRQMKTMDGNTAAAHVSYAFTEVAAIYPITPSSNMAEETDKMSANGVKNIFGQQVKVIEMQSEAGAAGAVHGSAVAGAVTSTYTASQGLLLMIPNMYKLAGEQLPCVFNVSARTIAAQSLSIFGDHSDIYACRQTGFAMLCSNSVQEAMDLGAVAYLSTIKSSLPFLHFFDGFRTSHEIQKIEAWDYDDLAEMVDRDALAKFKANASNPEHPVLRGSAQNGDVFFQTREACNKFYDAVPAVVEEYMNEVNKRIGTKYKLFNYYGAKDADRVIIAMGSVCETIEETVDYLNAKGEKVGLIKVHLYRPFSVKHLLSAIPNTVKSISVIDRTKEPGSIGEPLYLDVVTALRGTKFDSIPVYGGRYGLASKDTNPSCIAAVYRNMEAARPKKKFTVGIEDDVTNLSLKIKEKIDSTPKGTHCCKFWGLGADGTVGANKNSIKIIGDNTNMYAQGYFAYDSKKSGGVTISHLRFGKKPIKSTYYISSADFVACHNPSYVTKYKMVEDLKDGGTFLLNCSWDAAELEERLPASMKRYIAKHNIKFYTIDGTAIAKEIGLGGKVNTILQSAFFSLAKIIPSAEAIELMKAAATKSYGKKGEDVVKKNHAAIEAGAKGVKKVKVPKEWAKAVDAEVKTEVKCDKPALKEFVENILIPLNAQRGDELPVSALATLQAGVHPAGSAAFEKRGIAIDVPEWIPENCIQCNRCAFVCPHAVIRPFALDEKEAKNAPESLKTKPMTGMPNYQFTLAVSTLDCTGCGACANVCPGMKGNKALVMKPIDTQMIAQAGFDYAVEKVADKADVAEKFNAATVKGSQFKQPLLEFSGACAGCGETPYAKLVTQLYGDKMYLANATGCSSIWGGSSPATPYTTNKQGKGPAWANSLFEDNAEFGFGMFTAATQMRAKAAANIALIAKEGTGKLQAAAQAWLDTKDDIDANDAATAELIKAAEAAKPAKKIAQAVAEVIADKDFVSKKSVWIFGGDGWAYDIGYGGVDHVLAQNENVNILVFDTEVYSNTGGQASKSTPTGAVAQFAAAGKTVKKKDLAAIAMSYGYIYVAQIAMGADYNQTMKAITEAASYDGPSLIIAYAPCINHGIKGGMGIAMDEEKAAVDAGYWHLFRFDPRKAANGENPLTLDSKEPTASYQDFIMNEVRYASLTKAFPERAEVLFKQAEQMAKDKYAKLVKMSEK